MNTKAKSPEEVEQAAQLKRLRKIMPHTMERIEGFAAKVKNMDGQPITPETAERRERALQAHDDYVKHAIETKTDLSRPRIAVLTPEEDTAWTKAFEFYAANEVPDTEVDRLAWSELQEEFPRLRIFDGCANMTGKIPLVDELLHDTTKVEPFIYPEAATNPSSLQQTQELCSWMRCAT